MIVKNVQIISWVMVVLLMAPLSISANPFSTQPMSVIAHDYPCSKPAFNKQGNHLYIAARYGLDAIAFEAFDIQSSRKIIRRVVQKSPMNTKVFLHPEYGRAVLFREQEIQIVNLESENLNHPLPNVPLPIENGFNTYLCSPAGKMLACSEPFSEKIFVQQINGKSKHQLLPAEFISHDPDSYFYTTPLAISDQGVIIIGHTTGIVAFDIKKKHLQWNLDLPLTASISHATLSRDGAYLFVGYSDQKETTKHKGKVNKTSFKVLQIQSKTGEIQSQVDVKGLKAISASGDGQEAMLFSVNGFTSIWSPNQKPAVQTITTPGTPHAGVFSLDANLIAITSKNNGRYNTQIFSKSPQATEKVSSKEAVSQRLVIQTGHSSPVKAMAVSGDGQILATADTNGTIWLWQTQKGRAIRKLDLSVKQLDQVQIKALAFNPSRPELLILTQNGTFLWSLTDAPARMIQGEGWATFGEKAVIIPGTNHYVTISPNMSAAFIVHGDLQGETVAKHIHAEDGMKLDLPMEISPNGQIAVGTRDKENIVLVDTETGQITAKMPGPGGEIRAHAFSVDNRFLVTATSTDIVLYNIRDHKIAGHFKTRLQYIRTIAVHGPESIIIAAGADRDIAVIDFSKKEDQITYGPWKQKDSIDWTQELLISPDGKTLFQRCALEQPFIRIIEPGNATKRPSFVSHSVTGGQVRFSPEDRALIVSRPGAFSIWDFDNGGIETRQLSQKSSLFQSHPKRLGLLLVPGNNAVQNQQIVQFWSPGSGAVKAITVPTWVKHPVTAEGVINYIQKLGFSPDGSYLCIFEEHLQQLYGISKGKAVLKTTEELEVGVCHAFSPDSNIVAMKNKHDEIVAFDIGSNRELWRTALDFDAKALLFTSDGKHILALGMLSGMFGQISLLGAETGTQIEINPVLKSEGESYIPALNGHCANYLVKSQWDGTLSVIDISSQEIVYQTIIDNVQPVYAIEDKGGTLWIASKSKELIQIQPSSKNTPRVVKLFVSPNHLAINKDQTRLAVMNDDGSILLMDLKNNTPLARLVEFLDGSWAVVAGDGRYDASLPGDIPGLSWVLSDEPLTPYPVEIFYKEYYEPRLLARLLAKEKFSPVKLPTQVNRIQPLIKIESVEEQPQTPGRAKVTLTVKNIHGKQTKNRKTAVQDSGIFDVKLFRNGKMVGMSPRDGGQVIFNKKSGTGTVVFDSIPLPVKDKDKHILFTAYAFNRDGIKSETARKYYKPLKVSKKEKPRAYVISMGVNSYQTPAWDLRHAVNDAKVMSRQMVSSLLATKNFDSVIPVKLISDNKEQLDQIKASKKNIRAILKMLGSDSGTKKEIAPIPGTKDLKPAGPWDFVLISYSGHGYADQNGKFHLFPSDIGSHTTRKITPDLLANTITTDDLYSWLRGVDAGEVVFIIDACNSAASIQSQGFKPGPMGSRGLGQLAYDKGMRILTASQAEMVALESDQLQHGALTYALIREGVQAFAADLRPKDQAISVKEMLSYGMNRVPILYNEIRSGNVQPMDRGKILYLGSDKTQRKQLNVQQPGLFDFKKDSDEIIISRQADKN